MQTCASRFAVSSPSPASPWWASARWPWASGPMPQCSVWCARCCWRPYKMPAPTRSCAWAGSMKTTASRATCRRPTISTSRATRGPSPGWAPMASWERPRDAARDGPRRAALPDTHGQPATGPRGGAAASARLAAGALGRSGRRAVGPRRLRRRQLPGAAARARDRRARGPRRERARCGDATARSGHAAGGRRRGPRPGRRVGGEPGPRCPALRPHPGDATSYAGVAVGLTLAALVATLVPKRRAIGVDPAIALRGE